MSNPLRQQIDGMAPRRYARAAKRAASLAKRLADEAGTHVDPEILRLVEMTEDEIAAERERVVGESPRDNDSGYPAGGGGAATVSGPIQLPPTPEEHQQALTSRRAEAMSRLESMASWLQHVSSATLWDFESHPLHRRHLWPSFEAGATYLQELWDGLKTSPVYESRGFMTPGDVATMSAVTDDKELFLMDRGRSVKADDGSWLALKGVDGTELVISHPGKKPVSLSLRTDDQVRVDPSRDVVCITCTRQFRETRDRRSVSAFQVFLLFNARDFSFVETQLEISPVEKFDSGRWVVYRPDFP